MQRGQSPNTTILQTLTSYSMVGFDFLSSLRFNLNSTYALRYRIACILTFYRRRAIVVGHVAQLMRSLFYNPNVVSSSPTVANNFCS